MTSAAVGVRTIQVGLVGTGIAASRSPALHRAEGEANGLDYRYELFDLAGGPTDQGALATRLSAAEARGFRGLNITHPFKQRVIDLLDALSPEAEAVGAVNTVIFVEGRRIGHNTDWSGFAEGFGRALPGASLRSVVQLGSGGGGVAVAHALMTMGTERLTLIDRDPAKAQAAAASLAERFGAARVAVGDDPERVMWGSDGLVNATPVGMDAYPGLPLPEHLLRPDLWVADIVYFPLETALLRSARRLGCRTADGGGMAVFQAVGAFRLFSGVEPDADRMLDHFARLQAASRRPAD